MYVHAIAVVWYIPYCRSLDVTSCHVSDVGLQHVVSTIGCNLVSLKLGSTCITNKRYWTHVYYYICISTKCLMWHKHRSRDIHSYTLNQVKCVKNLSTHDWIKKIF